MFCAAAAIDDGKCLVGDFDWMHCCCSDKTRERTTYTGEQDDRATVKHDVQQLVRAPRDETSLAPTVLPPAARQRQNQNVESLQLLRIFTRRYPVCAFVHEILAVTCRPIPT